MVIVAMGGHAINDGNYVTSLEPGGHTPADVVPGFALRGAGGALVGGATSPERYFVLRTVLYPGASSRRLLQAQWYHWFRPAARMIQALVVEDEDGSNERYLQVMPISITHEADGDGLVLLTMLALHNDEVWRSVAVDEESWAVTASGQTVVVANGSEPRNEDAYPVYTLTPTSNKSNGDNLGVFATVTWDADQGGVGYPVDVADGALDTEALILAGKMMADGSDVVCQVDGVYVYPVLAGVDTDSTKVWLKLDFAAGRAFSLSATRASGSTSDIGVVEDVSGMPGAGLLLIGSELFSYTGVNVPARSFTGVTAAAKGTAAAGHSSGAGVRWIQHDIRILYGVLIADDVLPAPVEPLFDFENSTNSVWVYESFVDTEDEGRPGRWLFSGTNVQRYGSNHKGSTVTEFAELGMVSVASATVQYSGAWTLFNPCGITAADFSNGEMYHASRKVNWGAAVRSSVDGDSYAVEYAIPKPSAANAWESWSYDAVSLPAGSRYVQLFMSGEATATKIRYLECADVTVTLDSSRTPTAALGAEEVGYPLRATLSNLTTGEAVVITFNMPLDTSLEIDTDELRVRHLVDGSNQFRAVTPDGSRDTLLRLVAGENTLEFVDESTGNVTVGIVWRERWIN